MFETLANLIRKQLEGVARHLVTAGGAVLVTEGLMNDAQSSAIKAALSSGGLTGQAHTDAILGGVLALAAIGWSAYQKKHQQAETNTKVEAALYTTPPNQTAVQNPVATP